MAQHHRHDNYVTFGPNVNCTLAVCPVDWSVYEYRPSVPANVTLLVLFGVSLLIHLVQGLRWRTWSFMIAMILGCIDEIIGYAGRLMLYNNPFTFPGFLIQISMCKALNDLSSSSWDVVALTNSSHPSLHHDRRRLLLRGHISDFVEDVGPCVPGLVRKRATVAADSQAQSIRPRPLHLPLQTSILLLVFHSLRHRFPYPASRRWCIVLHQSRQQPERRQHLPGRVVLSGLYPHHFHRPVTRLRRSLLQA